MPTSASPGPVQYTCSRPRSASGSPSVQISQSSTATTAPVVVDHAVVEAVVAVDDRRRSLLRDPFAAMRREPGRRRRVRGSCPGSIARTSASAGVRCSPRGARDRRARPVSRSTAWIAAIVSTIDLLAAPAPPRRASTSDVDPVAQHVAVDEAHHVERRVVDRQVVAVTGDGGTGHGRALQAGEDAVLAAHVVGAGQHVAERWPAQHEPGAVGTRDAIREVRVTAGDRRRSGTVPSRRRRWPPASR